jgi:hypothetical protein
MHCTMDEALEAFEEGQKPQQFAEQLLEALEDRLKKRKEFIMDEDLRMHWEQLSGWAAALQDMCQRHIKGEPGPDPRDNRPPRAHIKRLVKDLGSIFAQIEVIENMAVFDPDREAV